jgi:serine/threonine-protein kinase
MSEVTVCTDTHLDRKVLIKNLKAGTDTRRLLDEIRALQAIRSKHVVQIYDVISNDRGEVAAIVEEYLPGNDLAVHPLPNDANEFLRLAYQIAEGIADIHCHKRVHRDIKPINMKFDAEQCIKIFDFGLARLEDVDASTIGVVGTRGFLAPELFRGDSKNTVTFTKAVDTFAFGSTALYLAVGALPASLKKMPPAIPNGEVDFSKAKFELPVRIVRKLNDCFALDPDDRPSMEEVTATIGAHLLHNRHRALIIEGARVHKLDASSPVVTLNSGALGSLRLTYDGLEFRASEVTGAVYVNNVQIADGHKLPGSCVITLGAPPLLNSRVNFTVDVSHPEVSL